jgi:ribosomal protein L37AE/L43A
MLLQRRKRIVKRGMNMSRMVEFVKAIQEGKFVCTECGKTASFMNVVENQEGVYICDNCLDVSAEHRLCDGCGAVLNTH